MCMLTLCPCLAQVQPVARDEWHGMCREQYMLKADVRVLKSFIGHNLSEPDYVKGVSDIISNTLESLHYNYLERGEKFICNSFTSTKKVPPDAQANFSYAGNISYFWICNKAIVKLSLDKMSENDITFTLTITAPCYIVRDFLKHLLFRASTMGILVL